MSWLSKLLPGRDDGTHLDQDAVDMLERWKALPEGDHNTAHFETRYSVVNTEATGLDLERDSLLSVGAIAIGEGQIASRDSYYAELDAHPDIRLAGLLSFVGKGPVVVFNADFNRTMLERTFEARLGFVPELLWLDLYILLPALFPEKIDRPARLANWMDIFGIETFQRHHALGDAWVIAQLMLAAQSRALSMAAISPRSLAEMERARRQLQRHT